jgi:hypothetical protein
MVAKQLLQKVIMYEKMNSQLEYEKKQLLQAKLKNETNSLESINLMYSILADFVVKNN